MAVMPSVGWIKQLSVLGVAAALLGVAAPRASAQNDVWLWACHNAAGTPVSLGGSHYGTSAGATTGTVTGDCATGPMTAALVAPEVGPNTAALTWNRRVAV